MVIVHGGSFRRCRVDTGTDGDKPALLWERRVARDISCNAGNVENVRDAQRVRAAAETVRIA